MQIRIVFFAFGSGTISSDIAIRPKIAAIVLKIVLRGLPFRGKLRESPYCALAARGTGLRPKLGLKLIKHGVFSE